MRGVTAVLMLILAACSTAGGDTTTTAQLAEPSTTTTVPFTTTTTEPTTTTTVEECTGRDGVLRTRRGSVCPPAMPVFDVDELAERHLPGTYVTRQFRPSISFTLPDTTWSRGERLGFVEIDFVDRGPRAVAERGFRIYGDEIAREVIPTGEQREDQWAVTETLVRTSVDIWGSEAEQVDFRLGETCRSGCNMAVRGTRLSQFTWDDSHHVRLVVVPLPDGRLAIEVFAPAPQFDTYWTEVAQPILDSIEFLDP